MMSQMLIAEVNNRAQSLKLNYLSALLSGGDFTLVYYQM